MIRQANVWEFCDIERVGKAPENLRKGEIFCVRTGKMTGSLVICVAQTYLIKRLSKSMKINNHNSFKFRFSSISDINRLITIDYYRLQSITIDFIDYRISSIGHAG